MSDDPKQLAEDALRRFSFGPDDIEILHALARALLSALASLENAEKIIPQLRTAIDLERVGRESAEAERDLLREELRIREQSQIPVIPRAAQERMDKLEAERYRYGRLLGLFADEAEQVAAPGSALASLVADARAALLPARSSTAEEEGMYGDWRDRGSGTGGNYGE